MVVLSTIGAADVIIKIILYYAHERSWYHSSFGIVDDGHHAETMHLFKKKPKMKPQQVKVPVTTIIKKPDNAD